MSFHLIPQAYAAGASTWTSNCVGLSNTGSWNGFGGINATDVATIGGIECVIKNLLTPLPGLIALAAVFMIIFAGSRIISAGSDAKALASAWAMFTYAVIGLILLSAVWLILVLIEKFTGAPVTQFGV